MPYNGQSQFNNQTEVTPIGGDLFLSGNKSVNYKLGLVKGAGAFALTSTRTGIDNSQFWANEYGIPTPGSSLDITFFPSAITLGIASTNVNDTSAGTGAQAVLITGLDSNYDEITEIISLSGQTEVNSTAQFLRVQSALVVASGSTGWNEGTIYIGGSDNTFTAGVPQQNVVRTIGVDAVDGKGLSGSNTSTYTIPRRFRGVPLNFKVATDATSVKPLLVRGIFIPFGLGEISIGNLVFNGSNEFTFDGFPAFEEKTDLIVRVRAKSATTVDLAAVYWEWNTINLDLVRTFN